jgi:hypothetical protein
MKTLAVALTMLAAATLNAAALEPHAPQHALTEHLSAGKNRYLGNWIAGATELSRQSVRSARCKRAQREVRGRISAAGPRDIPVLRTRAEIARPAK